MLLADQHVHTGFSFDARDSMEDMAAAAKARGVNTVCFTDHMDIYACRENGVTYDPECFIGHPLRRAAFERARETAQGMELRLGIELGAINHAPDVAREIAASDGLDLIIGSVHNLRGMNDFYFLDYSDADYCRRLSEKYLAECGEVAASGCCDVIGHIGYASRYMARQGTDFDVFTLYEPLRELFRSIAQRGVGIEVNTSGLRDSLRRAIPDLPALELYRRCGGEIITAGSDSHRAGDCGAGIAEAYELIRAAGFTHISVFRDRKPEFIKI